MNYYYLKNLFKKIMCYKSYYKLEDEYVINDKYLIIKYILYKFNKTNIDLYILFGFRLDYESYHIDIMLNNYKKIIKYDSTFINKNDKYFIYYNPFNCKYSSATLINIINNTIYEILFNDLNDKINNIIKTKKIIYKNEITKIEYIFDNTNIDNITKNLNKMLNDFTD